MRAKVRSLARQPWIVMPVVAILAVGVLFAVRDRGSNSDADATVALPSQARLVTASLGSQAQTISATGTVAAAETDDLSFTSSGTVTTVNVSAGDKVTAGQVFATIDPVDLDATVADAEASLAEAEATLDDHTDADASDTQLAADESAVQAAQDKLDAANEARDGAELVATFDGTVASVDLTVGEQLGSSGSGGTSQTGTGSGSGMSAANLGSSSPQVPGGGASSSSDTTSSAQIQVISAGRFTVEVSVDAADVSKLVAGQTATIALSTSTSGSNGFPGGGFPGGGFPGGGATAGAAGTRNSASTSSGSTTVAGSEITGIVTSVGKVADASSGVSSFPVTVAFDDAGGTFNPGANAEVTITYAEGDEALLVPSMAVTTDGDTSTVQLAEGGNADALTKRDVTVGKTVNGMTAITSGLKEGDQVALTGRGGFGQGGGASGGFNPPDGAEMPGVDGAETAGPGAQSGGEG